MADKFAGYDDAQVTLGDGCLNIESAMFGVEKVAGSRSFVRDPRLSHLVRGQGSSRPEKIAAIPRDKDGKPMRFCSGGHYAPRGEFGKLTRNLFHSDRSGLDDMCIDCRRVQRNNHKRTSSMAS